MIVKTSEKLDENNIRINGKCYTTVKSESCSGCDTNKYCGQMPAYCSGSSRTDGYSVKWKYVKQSETFGLKKKKVKKAIDKRSEDAKLICNLLLG